MDKRILLGGSADYKKGSSPKLLSKNILTSSIESTVGRFDSFNTNEFKVAYLVLYWKAGGENRITANDLISKMKSQGRGKGSFILSNIADQTEKLLICSYEDLIPLIDKGIPYEDLSSILFIATLVYSIFKTVSFRGIIFTEKQLEKIRYGRL